MILECVWHTVGIVFATILSASITKLSNYLNMKLIIELLINCYEKFYISISPNHTQIFN